MGEVIETLPAHRSSFAAPIVFIVVVAFQFLSRWLEQLKKGGVSATATRLRGEIKDLLKEASSLSHFKFLSFIVSGVSLDYLQLHDLCFCLNPGRRLLRKLRKNLQIEDFRKKLQSRDGRPGHRIKSHNADGNEVEEEHQGSKDTGERITKAKETHLVVATLIATVTFAAGFTMPGGYQSERGSDQGSPILSRNTAFKAFVITDTLAMSSCSVLVLLYSSIHTKGKYMNQISSTFEMVVNLTMLALIARVIAFVTGTYAILGGHSLGFARAACVLGCFFFYFFAHSVLSLERKILRAPHFLFHLHAGFFFLFIDSCIVLLNKMLPKPT